MKEQKKTNKKPWVSPSVQTLSIRLDTASGIGPGPEGAGRSSTPPQPPGRS